MGCKIVASGKALPRRVVTNDEMSNVVETNDEWIASRTGIRERHIAVEETSCDLAEQASRAALKKRGASAADIDLIICATITPDSIIPSQAGLLKVRLGSSHAIAFDVNAACTGCIYGIVIASSMMESSHAQAAAAKEHGNPAPHAVIRRALVVGVDRLSRITEWDNRSTCVLFADGAGAVVLEWDDEATGVMSSYLKNTDDEAFDLACAHLYYMDDFPFADDPDGMARTGRTNDQVGFSTSDGASDENAFDAPTVAPNGDEIDWSRLDRPFISMHGQHVFKFASAAMVEAIEKVVTRAGITLDDVACIVPHQANERIIRYAAKKIGKPIDFFQMSIEHMGNTSASSVPAALDDAYEAGRIRPGDKVIIVGFGGGLTSGALLFEA